MHFAAKRALGHFPYQMSPAQGPLYYRGYQTAVQQRVNTRLSNDPQFEVGNVVKSSRYAYRTVVEQRGQYVKLQYLGEDVTLWTNAALWEFIAMDKREYEFQQKIKAVEFERDQAIKKAEAEAKQRAIELSRNTVTRALVHASSNGYCSETAVALISAGHKLPDVTLDLEVTLRASVTLKGNTSYYPLRDLFGATKGNVQGARDIDVHTDQLQQKLQEHFGVDKFDYVSAVKLRNTEVEWHEPANRMLSTSEAVQEFESEQDNDND